MAKKKDFAKWKPTHLSVGDSPLEALRKACVAVFSEAFYRTFQKAIQNQKTSAYLVRSVSFCQSNKAWMMKNLLANPSCGYSSVTRFSPKLAALSLSKTAAALLVAGGSFAMTKGFEVVPHMGLRQETRSQISSLQQDLVDLADDKKKLQSSVESLVAEKKALEASLQLLQARVASVELLQARVERLETASSASSASWFGWLKKTLGYSHK